MKKLFAILSLVALLLCGCGKNDTPAATGETPEPAPTIGAGEAAIPEDGDIVIPIG